MSTYAGSKTPVSTPATPRKGDRGSRPVECGVRYLISQENGDQRFVPLYDSQRSEEGLRHPDELSLQAIMQMVHGSLPLRLDRAYTKVHWTNVGSVSQMLVTKLFKCTFPRKLVDSRGTSIKHRGSNSSLSSSYGSSESCFQCKTTFAVVMAVTLFSDSKAAALKRPGTATPSLPGTPRCESFMSRTQLSRSLAGLQSLDDTHSAFDDATMYTRDNCEMLFTDNDSYSPDMGLFTSEGRPACSEGIIDVLQSHFGFVNHLVQGLMDKAGDALHQYVISNTTPVFVDSHFRVRPHELSSCSILSRALSTVRTTLMSFLHPVYLLQEKCRSSLSSSSSILPYMTSFKKAVDFQLLCSVVTAALQHHQGWLIADAKKETTQRLSLCRFLVHGKDKGLVKALLVLLSFFVKCGEVTHSCVPLSTTVFPPALDFTYSSQEQLSGLLEGSPTSSASSSPRNKRFSEEACEVGVVGVAAGVSLVSVVCGSCVWFVKGQFSSLATVSPVPSSTYCYGAMVKTACSPFLIIGLDKLDVHNEDVAVYEEAEVPSWMPCHREDGCIVVDVARKTCALHKEGAVTDVVVSSSVRQYLKSCLDCYEAGVPPVDCEESLQLGLAEITALGYSVISSLSHLPQGTSAEALRASLLGVSKTDLPLVVSTAHALDPRVSVKIREGKKVWEGVLKKNYTRSTMGWRKPPALRKKVE